MARQARYDPHELIHGRGVDPEILRAVLDVGVEIAREGREGRKIGTIFTVGDHESVLAFSRPLILDPLAGHPDSVRQLSHPGMKETLKELAQLDGAFVITDSGVVVAAARYLNTGVEGVQIQLGLGSRHLAAAAITKATRCVAIVVSESSVVRVLHGGAIVGEIVPEVYLFQQWQRLSRARERG